MNNNNSVCLLVLHEYSIYIYTFFVVAMTEEERRRNLG